MLKGKNIAITGGSGFIGRHLIREISHHQPKGIFNFDISCGIDLTSYSELRVALVYRKIDIVFHLATLPLPLSLVNPYKVLYTIPLMSQNLCELCRLGFYKTLIQISSSEAYGSAIYVPMNEKHPLNPITPYAAAKASADLILLSYFQTFSIDARIVRCFNTYGEEQPISLGAIIPKTIVTILKGNRPEIYGNGNQTRDFTYVGDIVKGIIKVYEFPSTRGKVINIASGKETTINELVRKICDILKSKKRIKYIGKRIADVERHFADISVAKKLGYSPSISLDEGLKRTIKYYVDNLSFIEDIRPL